MKSKLQIKNSKPYLWLFLITSALFGVLFLRFILGEYGYFYTDIGADTFDINYPLYSLFSQTFHGEAQGVYYLNAGLGADMSSYYYQYLNPINLLVVLLPEHLIPWGVLLATYVKLMMISIFSFKLFQKWIGNVWGSFGAALVWTFSGYVMLWGQHYGFCTSMAMFTVFFYLLHRYVDDKEKSQNWILVIWVTFMLITNYYFLYMGGIMGACYVVIYLVFQKKSPKKILGKLCGLAGMGILGVVIGGICLIPTWNGFQGSTRADDVAVKSITSLFSMPSIRKLHSILGRFFSNNAMGIAFDYTGSVNYYEVAVLSSSSLFVLSLPRLLAEKGVRLRTALLTVISVILLLLPVTGKVLNMNANSQRWTFILCFMEAFAVGYGIKLYLERKEKDSLKMFLSLGAGILLTAGGFAMLFSGEKAGEYQLETKYLYLYGCFLLIYAVLIVVAHVVKTENKVLPVLLMGVLCVEMVLVNYPTINDRESPTRNQIATEDYNDGTKEVYQQLRQQDDSLYRVSKTYESVSENDSLVQGYPGLSAYFSTNPKELIQLKEMYGGEGISDNFVSFGNSNFLLNSLLGVKYLIAHTGDVVEEENYKEILAFQDKILYENQNALPFGYLYHKIWTEEQVKEMSIADRTLAAVHGFYFSGDSNEVSQVPYDKAVLEKSQGVSLMEREFEMADCQATKNAQGITISQMMADPHIVMRNVTDVFGDDILQVISMEVEVSQPVEMALYYKTDVKKEFNGQQVCTFTVTPKESTWTQVLPGNITDIRIDVSTKTDEVLIREISVDSSQASNQAYTQLKNTDIQEIQYEDGNYSAIVTNSSSDTAMLGVPLLYSKGWSVRLDGENVDLYNINSGLCGIEIPSGSHRVNLIYEIPHKQAGVLLSTVGIVIYLLVFLGGSLWKRRKANS